MHVLFVPVWAVNCREFLKTQFERFELKIFIFLYPFTVNEDKCGSQLLCVTIYLTVRMCKSVQYFIFTS
jgi:hypothetical protein